MPGLASRGVHEVEVSRRNDHNRAVWTEERTRKRGIGMRTDEREDEVE